MKGKRFYLPLVLFLAIFFPILYFALRWQAYYNAVKIIAPDTTYQILLGFMILFTVFSTLMLCFWAIYMCYLFLKAKENKSLQPLVVVLFFACTAISSSAIYRGYVALFKEGFQLSWYRIYTQSHHINFISNWFNLFILPLLLIALLLGLIYYLVKTKNHNLANITLFGSFSILLFWCFISNYLHWSLELQSPMYQLLSSRYEDMGLRYNLLYFYNPIQILISFFRSLSNFFQVNQIFPTGLDMFSATLRINPNNSLFILNSDKLLSNVKPSLSFIFYARTLIILALTSFMSLIHYELLKTSSQETPRSK
jgi:hypothetical protein